METRPLTLELSAAALRRLYIVLFAASGVFIAATFLSDLQLPLVANPIGRQLDLKLEDNAGVWFSSTILFLVATAARGVAQAGRAVPARRLWTVLALFFLGLSIDETAQIHDRVGVRITASLGTVPFLTEGTHPQFAWLLVFFPFAVAFVVSLRAALRASPGVPPRPRALMLGALACWIGVLGAEFVEAQLMRWSLNRSIEGAIEEGLELAGSILFLVAFVELLRAIERPCLSAADEPGKMMASPDAGPSPRATTDPTWRASRFSRTTRS